MPKNDSTRLGIFLKKMTTLYFQIRLNYHKNTFHGNIENVDNFTASRATNQKHTIEI